MRPIKIIYSNVEDAAKAMGLGMELVELSEYVHEPNTIYIGIGNEVFNHVADTVHLGLRGSGFWNVVSMKRVGLNDNSDYIFAYPEILDDCIKRAKDPDLQKPTTDIAVPEYEDIRDIDRALEVLDYLTCLPEGTWFGVDYESNSFPNCADFVLTGLGISTLTESFWFDYRFLCDTPRATHAEYKNNPDKTLKQLLDAECEFFDKHSDHCVVFSVQFELFATYRYNGKMYYFKDLNACNIMEGEGLYNNLKYTVRKRNNVNSWDDEFDALNDGDYFKEDGSLDTKKLKEENPWLTTADLMEMINHYKVCQSLFYIIPGRWLGKYCCMDSYYTVKTFVDWLSRFNYTGKPLTTIGDRIETMPTFPVEDRWKVMSEAAIDIYTDGKLAEAIVSRAGMLVDSELLQNYTDLHFKILIHSITNNAIYCFTKRMEKIKDNITPLEEFSPFAAKLIAEGIDVSQDPFYLSKELLSYRYFDESYPGAFNTNKVYEDFGEEVGQTFIDTVWEYCDDLYNVNRKRSVHGLIGEILGTQLNLTEDQLSRYQDTITYYENRNYLTMFQSLPWVGKTYHEIPDRYEMNGETYNLWELYEYLFGYFNNNTAQSEIFEHVHENIGDHLYFWALLYYYEDIIKRFKTDDLLYDLNNFVENAADLITEDELELARVQIEEVGCFNWFFEGNIFFQLISYHYPNYEEKLKDLILRGCTTDPDYGGIVAGVLCRSFAKYFKTLTYYTGLFKDHNTYHGSIDDLWIPDFGTEEGPCEMAHPYFTANSQFSFRWSSNFHTVPSRNNMKRIVTTPDDALFAYFDISSMEIRQIAYLSRDKNLVNLFETKQDVYIYCAKRLLGEKFEKLEDWEKMDYRSDFKVVFLAYFYLRGARSLAPELGKTVEETQELMNSLGETFAEALEFRKYVSEYPIEHDGKLLMPFGETIISEEEEHRQRRHGINTLIQGSSAVMLVLGFFNCFRQAQKLGKRLRHIGFVHDSSQTYFDVHMLWECLGFFYTHVTKFLWDRFRVNMAFDVNVGANYFDVCDLSQISDDVVQVKGNSRSINGILKKLRKNNIPFEIIDEDQFDLDENKLLKEIYQDPLIEFAYDPSQTVCEIDNSDKVKMKLRKL